MMQTGIFSGYFPYGLEKTAQTIRSHNFNTGQLDMHFKDLDVTDGQITKDKCIQVRETFRNHHLPISAISCYTNIINPDPAKRKVLLDRLKEILRHAQYLGSPFVCSETGTFDTTSDWVHHPENKTEEGWDECRTVIAELAQYAYDHGAVFLLETYVNNVVGSVEETLRMFAEVDHPGLGLIMDPTNYFEDHNIDKMNETLNYVFDSLSEKVCLAHAKDVARAVDDSSEKHADIGDADAPESHTFRGVGAIELPAPGLGVLNYDLYLQRLAKKHPNIPMIIEHLDESDVPRAKAFLDQKLSENGL